MVKRRREITLGFELGGKTGSMDPSSRGRGWRGFGCRRVISERLKRAYQSMVESEYKGDYMSALERFEEFSEKKLRPLLNNFYREQRSRDQAWKTCKGELYEYAVLKALKQAVEKDPRLRGRLAILSKDELPDALMRRIAIRNWSDIYPDVDIMVVDSEGTVRAIASCKTSVRERLTQTAFWKGLLARNEETREVKVIFFTTDKDNELHLETNRYIVHHILDCTFVTEQRRYEELLREYMQRYRDREAFSELLSKVRQVSALPDFLAEVMGPDQSQPS